MLEKVGFCGKWIHLIKCCLESASVSVLVNGSLTKEFYLKRGLRQGDPLQKKVWQVCQGWQLRKT